MYKQLIGFDRLKFSDLRQRKQTMQLQRRRVNSKSTRDALAKTKKTKTKTN